MTHSEKATDFLMQEFHCSQALAGAFAEEFGYNLKNVMKISTCFGGGMHRGDLCGCITAATMIFGMAFGLYDPQDKELESFGYKNADEFFYRFREKMGGKTLCKEILGKDFSKPEELAEIRKEGLVKKVCPHVLQASIEIIEDMLKRQDEEGLYVRLDAADFEETEKLQTVIKSVNEQNRFRNNVRDLLLSSDRKIGFIQFDVRRFKIINDLYGEKFGDEVLFFVKDNLKELCSDRQFFLNLRSDVFMVVTEYEDDSELLEFIHKIETASASFKNVKLQLAFGVYSVDDKDMEIRQMEDRTAMARTAAKENVVSNVIFYEEQFKELLYTRKFIDENMHSAIAEKQFKMYLQPKYSISRNKIVGAEALVRWIHPERGMIYPNEFIPVIEENGFIKMVDYYIWEEASRFIKKCTDIGIEDCPVSVNVSRNHLKDTEFMYVLMDDIKKHQIEKSLLELEITETANDEQIGQMAMRLKIDGFTLLMDDFGSGYSSLNMLLETPFDVIKLDKKFMDNMMASDKGKLILEHMVSMAQKLGLGLLAEGVETKEQVDLLEKIGCDNVQGYYFARPMPQEDFFELLKKDRGVLENQEIGE
ncbi:MAG: EAL domain-containing protein [Lachnospiraceae bacterium]|nr:EAL domain-containing protein [Lachnospiraceae bacterium]